MTPNPTPDPEDDTIRTREDLEKALPEGLPIFEVTEMPNLVELIKKWRLDEKENPETD